MDRRPRYFYPDDVIRTKDGAVMGYECTLKTDGSVKFTSTLPVEIPAADLRRLEDLYFRIWEDARIEGRKHKTDCFLAQSYPHVMAERQAWDKYVETVGPGNASLSGFNRAREKA